MSALHAGFWEGPLSLCPVVSCPFEGHAAAIVTEIKLGDTCMWQLVLWEGVSLFTGLNYCTGLLDSPKLP